MGALALSFANPPQVFIFLQRILEDRVANHLYRLFLVFTDDLLNLQLFPLIAAVVNAIRIEKNDVALAHQRDFRDVGLPHVPLAEAER